MKKKIALPILVIVAVVLILIGYVSGITKKGSFCIVDVIIDVTDMQAVVDSVDCIFVGTVTDTNTLIFDYDDPSEINVKVVENIKGDLPLETTVYKYGGHFINGNEVEYRVSDESFTPIPEVGRQYIFFAFKQADGKVMLSEYYGNIDYTGTEQVSEISRYVEIK